MTALTGNETLTVLGNNNGSPAAYGFTTTVGAIAALASTESAPFIVTPITTAGNGTLTAAGLVGGEIVRTGPSANFSDATDTAANIIAALPGAVVTSSFSILIKNATPYTQTITAGAGVTLPATVIVPAFSVINYIATVATASTITMVHIDTVPVGIGTNTTAPLITALSTVGAGTITAASFVGGITSRSGSQSGTPFTDTTDTAANIIAACANLVNKIGTSMLYIYSNTTNAVATLTGGTGVTVSGITAVPANASAQYLVTYTAAATLTMVGVSISQNISTAFTLAGSSSGQTIVQAAAAASGTLTLPAVTDTVAVLGTAQTYTAAQTFTNSDIKLLGSSTGATTFTSANAGSSSFTVTVPGSSGVLAYLNLAPVGVGSSLAVTAAAHSGVTLLLNTAGGSTATLPAATGTGNKYYFFVSTSTTSAAHKILAASSSDNLIGNVTGQTGNAVKQFTGLVSNTFHSLQMPNSGSQPSGGIQGDWFEFTDLATNVWGVKGMYSAGTTPTTPFSTATS